MSGYVELHGRSAFSFLRGASSPEQLAKHAAELGLPAIALCDRDGVYGAPRLFAAAREHGIRAIVGAELTMEDDTVLPVLVESRTGYRNLFRLITRAKLRGTKTDHAVRYDELPEFAEGLVCLTGDEEGPLFKALIFDDLDGGREVLLRLRGIFGDRHLFIEVQRHLWRIEDRVLGASAALAREFGLPLLATNGVLYAEAGGEQVLDVMTCARFHTTLDTAGQLLSLNAARHLKSAAQMRRLFVQMPEAVTNTFLLAERLEFSLENLGYEFPRYRTPEGETMDECLRRVTLEGARGRYGAKPSMKVRRQLVKELDLIGRLGFAGYFLIVWDLVNFARENNVMVQGRGSAANSAVCYSLGITAVDPVGGDLLFERFLSEGRKSWPDIDLDLPSGERREWVIQEVYRRYGERGAAMTANVITYRGRSAMREIGKALALPLDTIDRFSKLFASGDFPHTIDLHEQVRQAGLPMGLHHRSPGRRGAPRILRGQRFEPAARRGPARSAREPTVPVAARFPSARGPRPGRTAHPGSLGRVERVGRSPARCALVGGNAAREGTGPLRSGRRFGRCLFTPGPDGRGRTLAGRLRWHEPDHRAARDSPAAAPFAGRGLERSRPSRRRGRAAGAHRGQRDLSPAARDGQRLCVRELGG